MSNPNSAGQPAQQQAIVVYSTDWCPYCTRAKAFLKKKGFTFEEINVEGDAAKREWLVKATGQRTVPQVFIGERSVGGFDEISALDRSGELDRLVRGA
ncbi:MAG: glutaredoxin 3 [Polyangiales bacterium]